MRYATNACSPLKRGDDASLSYRGFVPCNTLLPRVDVHLSRLHGDARAVAERSGVLDSIGKDHVHLTVAAAVGVADEDVLQRPSPTNPSAQLKVDES